MREKCITRTVTMSLINVSLYNKVTKSIEAQSIITPEVCDPNKFLAKKFEGSDYVILEYECFLSEHKYSMSVEDFVKYAKEV